MVYMSSKPCVGCACLPSPALITCTCGATWRAIRYGAPLDAWRTTNMSACIAVRLLNVSSSDSPLAVEERVMSRLKTSADRRRAAISKVVRVRVLFSKKRLNTDRPRSSGTLLTSRSAMLMKLSAVVRMRSRIARGSPSMESRWCNSPLRLSCGLRPASVTALLQGEMQPAFRVPRQLDTDRTRHFDRCPDNGCFDGQLAPTTIDE